MSIILNILKLICTSRYRYLVSYGFNRKVGPSLQYEEFGTGRTILNFTKKISSDNDIIKVENILKDYLNIENLENLSLYSYSLVCKVGILDNLKLAISTWKKAGKEYKQEKTKE